MSALPNAGDPVLATTRKSPWRRGLAVVIGLMGVAVLGPLTYWLSIWGWVKADYPASQVLVGLSVATAMGTLVSLIVVFNRVTGREMRTEITAHEMRVVGGKRTYKSLSLAGIRDVTFLPGQEGSGSEYPYPSSDPRVLRWPKSKILVTDGSTWIEFHDGRGWAEAVQALRGWALRRPEIVPDHETAWLLGLTTEK